MRVLVVSESPSERTRCRNALALVPEVEVTEAVAANQARDSIREGAVDVVVMDGDLRPKGGYSALYELRAQAELDGGKLPPVIMLAARPDDHWLAGWARADAIVDKPVDVFRLADAVTSLGGAARAGAGATGEPA